MIDHVSGQSIVQASQETLGGAHITSKGTLMGTPNREPQEYSRNIMEYKDPGRYIPIIYLLYSWGSRFGVPSRVSLTSKAFAPRSCPSETRGLGFRQAPVLEGERGDAVYHEV